ncbi:hypothetical protein BJ170DRAFT_479871 [Xylariales sp. AK1849]|nr:hypothetical protein BJ170DRAFT_479871 [Xylariales sp. AK1849]
MDSSQANSPITSGDEDFFANDEVIVNMGRERDNQPRGRGQPPKRTELDLSAMMNVEQKVQLLNLINAIIEGMYQRLRDTFDTIGQGRDDSEAGICPPKATWNIIPNPRSVKYAHLYGLTPLLPDSPNDAPKEKIKLGLEPPAPTLPPGMTLLRLPKSPEEATTMSGKGNENEIMVASMSEMKRDLLAFFGKWRVSVLKRTGDIVIKSGGNGGNVAGQGPQPSAAPTAGMSVEASNAVSVRQYPATSTPLSSVQKEKRALILHSMLLLLLSLEGYSTYSRVLLLYLASSLHIPMHVLTQDERRVAQSLAQVVKGITTEEIAQRRAEEGKSSRRWKGGPGNAATPGNSGGLAMPLLAAGIGTVFGGLGLGASAAAGLLGAMAESTVVVGTLFGLYGARATGKMMDSYAKDVQNFALVPLHGSLDKELIDPKDLPAEDRRLRVTIGISGWYRQKEDVINPWRALGHQNEIYALRWELESLTKMGNALEIVTKSAAWSEAKKEITSRTVFASLEQAVWPIPLLQISKIIDNPWSVGMVRAEKAGQVLADAIMNKVGGERGVTLIGYSLGARIIYACLMQLAEKRCYGYVENVVIMGSPSPTEVRVWVAMKSVVAGRLVNVYSKNDYILGFLYRTSSWHYGVAGLQRIQGVQGVENFDASEIVSNHLRYQCLVGRILKRLGWEDIDINEVKKQEDGLALMVDGEKQLDKNREERGPMNIPKKPIDMPNQPKLQIVGQV